MTKRLHFSFRSIIPCSQGCSPWKRSGGHLQLKLNRSISNTNNASLHGHCPPASPSHYALLRNAYSISAAVIQVIILPGRQAGVEPPIPVWLRYWVDRRQWRQPASMNKRHGKYSQAIERPRTIYTLHYAYFINLDWHTNTGEARGFRVGAEGWGGTVVHLLQYRGLRALSQIFFKLNL